MKNRHFSFCFFIFCIVILQGCKKDPALISPTTIISAPLNTDEQYSGGATTIFDFSQNAFGHGAPNLSGNGPDRFVVGNSFFTNDWVTAPSSTAARDGIGPIMNALSCSGCHKNDGRGRPPVLPGEKLSSMLIRLSIPGANAHNGPLGDPNYGDQFNNLAIQNVVPEGSAIVNYIETLYHYSDGNSYSLRAPTYQFTNLGYGALASNIQISPRVAPQMPGLGLLEAIDENTLLSHADPSDANGDGVSGRPNYVWDYINNRVSFGRFGWKANQPTIRQQTAGAFIGDMGISSNIFPVQNLTGLQITQHHYDTLPTGGNPEISDSIFDYVTYYSATLAVPGRRNWTDANVVKGKQLFVSIGCASCHTPSYTTSYYSYVPELSNQKIFPYTDLLLHDMGPELADGRPDYLATGQEWRTPPLWGIGMVQTVSGHTYFMHDGRARNFEEAVLWHGGEGETAKNNFKQLSKADRDNLIKFLQSL